MPPAYAGATPEAGRDRSSGTFGKENMKPVLKWTMISGGTLTLCGPAIGFLGTVIGMMRSFNTLGASGVATPERLSADISITLVSTAVGLVVGCIGFVAFLTALIVWLCTRAKTPPIAPSESIVQP